VTRTIDFFQPDYRFLSATQFHVKRGWIPLRTDSLLPGYRI
jgi:hypothetical protein